MDMAMPGGGSFWGSELIKAVQNGSVPESRVTDMAIRYGCLIRRPGNY